MSILVVSPHFQFVESVRGILTLWGTGTLGAIHGCKRASELHSHVANHKRQVRLVLIDGDTPKHEVSSILALMDQHPSFQCTVRGWVDSSDWGSIDLQRFHFRVRRPFAARGLLKSVFEGSRKERTSRSGAVHLGPLLDGGAGLSSLPILQIEHPDDPRLLSQISPRIRSSIFLVQPHGIDPDMLGWLKRFKKTAVGSQAHFVCLGRSPEKTRELRTLCNSFIEVPRTNQEWRAALAQTEERFASMFDLEWRMMALKGCLKSDDLASARWHLGRLTRYHPNAVETKIAAGRVFKKLGKLEKAARAFQEAATLDPCNPEVYAQLLAIHQSFSERGKVIGIESSELRKKAQDYCPNCTELLEIG